MGQNEGESYRELRLTIPKNRKRRSETLTGVLLLDKKVLTAQSQPMPYLA